MALGGIRFLVPDGPARPVVGSVDDAVTLAFTIRAAGSCLVVGLTGDDEVEVVADFAADTSLRSGRERLEAVVALVSELPRVERAVVVTGALDGGSQRPCPSHWTRAAAAARRAGATLHGWVHVNQVDVAAAGPLEPRSPRCG